MAKSENQSLQVAVILFAFVTIALSVATFYFFNEATVNLENRLAADEKAEKADAFLKSTLIENRNLKQKIIGVGQETKFTEIEKAKFELLLQLSAGMPDKDKLTLFQALKALLSTVTFTKEQITAALKKNNELHVRNALDIDASIAREKVVNMAFKKRSEDFTKILKKRGDQEVKLILTTNHLISIIKKKNGDYAKLVAEKVAELAKLERKMGIGTRELYILKTRQYETQNWNFDRPDGRIVSVNAGRNSVWINIGRADELRLNIKFKVFKGGHDNVYKRQPKGAIEVTRFMGRGMAEARIITYKDADPILDGDVIFTPIWSPGEPEIFVLAGDFDVNDDKKPDNKLIRRLIHISGGIIEDKLSINTRYLLVGTPSKNDAGLVKTLTEEAKQKGIRIMSLRQFLEYADMGRWLHDLDDVMRNREAFKKNRFKSVPGSDTRRVGLGTQLSGSSQDRTTQPSKRGNITDRRED